MNNGVVLLPLPSSVLSTHHSGSTGVMSIRGGAPKGKDVGLAMTSSSGVRGLSPWRHDSGGSCRLPEKRRWPRRKSTPSVQDGDVKDSLRQQSGGSLLSWKQKERKKEVHEMKQHSLHIHFESQRKREKEKQEIWDNKNAVFYYRSQTSFSSSSTVCPVRGATGLVWQKTALTTIKSLIILSVDLLQ